MARAKRTRTIGYDLNKMSHEMRSAVLEIGMDVLGELAEAVAERANEYAPVIDDEFGGFQPLRRGPNKNGRSDSGPIKGNVFAQESQKVPLSWLVISPAWYSHFTEFGTSSHTLPRKSKRGKKMMFAGTNEFAGERIMTDKVNHPGHSPIPFMRPAADRAEQLLRAILVKRGFAG